VGRGLCGPWLWWFGLRHEQSAYLQLKEPWELLKNFAIEGEVQRERKNVQFKI
jgi:hypothetical protein